MRNLPTGTVTFLFTDIEGSTALLQRLGDERYAEVLIAPVALEFGAGGDQAAIRAEMGNDAFEAAQTEGRAMTLEDAIEYAVTDADL